MYFTTEQLNEGILIIKSFEKRSTIYPQDYAVITERLYDLGIEISKRKKKKEKQQFYYENYYKG